MISMGVSLALFAVMAEGGVWVRTEDILSGQVSGESQLLPPDIIATQTGNVITGMYSSTFLFITKRVEGSTQANPPAWTSKYTPLATFFQKLTFSGTATGVAGQQAYAKWAYVNPFNREWWEYQVDGNTVQQEMRHAWINSSLGMQVLYRSPRGN